MEIEKFIFDQARANGSLWSLLLVLTFFAFKGLAKIFDVIVGDTKARLASMEKQLADCEKKHESALEEAKKLYKELNRLTEEMATYRGQLDTIKNLAVVKSTVDKVAGAALLRSIKDDPNELKTLLREIENDEPGPRI